MGVRKSSHQGRYWSSSPLVFSLLPWPIDDFHGRMYTAAFLTLATGAAVSRARATLAEIRAIGATALAFGA